MAKLPKALNEAEETFALQCKCYHLGPDREHVFCPGRNWRIDFAWPALRLAVEIEGGVHRIKGRFERDIEKYNTMTMMGWKLLRFTKKMVERGEALEKVQAIIIQLGGLQK